MVFLPSWMEGLLDGGDACIDGHILPQFPAKYNVFRVARSVKRFRSLGRQKAFQCLGKVPRDWVVPSSTGARQTHRHL